MEGHQPSLPQGNRPGTPVARRRTWQVGQRAAQAALIFLLLLDGFLSLFPLGRALTRSALLLPALLSASAPAPLLVASDSVRFTRVTLSSSIGPIFLDIYEPTTPPPPVPGGREVIIDVPGAGDNRALPQLVNLSQSLARVGIVEVNVGTPTLFNYQVSAQDGEAVVQAFKFMERWPGVDPQRIGIISFSVGVLLACVGAADPRIRDHVAFLASLGGYVNVSSLIRTLATRSQVVNGQAHPWKPIPTDLYVLWRTVSSLFTPADHKLFQKAFPLTVNLAPPLSPQEQAQFSPQGRAYYHLLEGDQPASVESNLAMLPARLRALLARLSPLSVLGQIRAPVHLLHDRNDPSIPYSQALEFAAALERLHHPYDFAAFSIFSHVQVEANLGLGQLLSDGFKLLEVLTRILLVGS